MRFFKQRAQVKRLISLSLNPAAPAPRLNHRTAPWLSTRTSDLQCQALSGLGLICLQMSLVQLQSICANHMLVLSVIIRRPVEIV